MMLPQATKEYISVLIQGRGDPDLGARVIESWPGEEQ